MRTNAYVSIVLLSQNDAGIFFSMRTHTIVHGTSRWLTNRVEVFCRFALSFDVLFAIVAFKTLMLKAVDLFAADSLIIKKEIKPFFVKCYIFLQAYMRPPMKSTAVQIARIAAVTLITMSVVLGSFILAASWVQARASCTPESIAAMQAELKQQQQTFGTYQPQGEFLKHLQPEALVQVRIQKINAGIN